MSFIMSISDRVAGFFTGLVYHGAVIPIMSVAACLIVLHSLGFISGYAESERLRANGISIVTMADVGQGDGFLIRLSSGQSFAVDVGERADRFLSAVRKPSFLNFGKKESLRADMVFLSHDDADHAGALQGVLRDMSVGALVVSAFAYHHVDDLKKESARHAMRDPDVLVRVSSAGDRFLISKSAGSRGSRESKESVAASIRILWPRADSFGSPDFDRRSANDDSLVMLVTIASTSIMLTGDISEHVESLLIKRYGMEMMSDILKVGHHGSRTSSSAEFLKSVSPRIALISAGKNNQYRHPSKDALKRLSAIGARIIRTDACGSVRIFIFESGAMGMPAC